AAGAALVLAVPGQASAPAVYLSPSGVDSANCTKSHPCRSFQRGYEAAQPGEVVLLAGGNYGDQEMHTDATKNAPRVVFAPCSGCHVSADDLTLRGVAHAQFNDLTVADAIFATAENGSSVPEGARTEDVRFVRATSRIFFVRGVKDVTYADG